MSGFGGFAPISNNSTVNQPAIQPGGVEPPPNAPAPNEPPQEAPAGVPGGDAAAQELVRSLDVLLARAGKAAGRTVDEAAIAKLAKGAKFDKATVDSLRATAKAANEAMRVLDSFTGEDFANAMEVNQETGVVDWNKSSYVGKSVKAALDKQQALSDALTKLLNDLPANATADQQAAIEEAMLQCDRRIGEIETVILELTNIAKDGVDNVDDRQQATLDRRVVDLAAEKALEMHDRSQAIAAFQRQLAPVLMQLDAFDAHPEQPATKAQLTTFRNRIAEARNAIAGAAKSGVVRIPKAGGGTRELFVDRSFLDEAAKLLGEAEAKLKKLRESAALDLRRRFVRKDVGFPSVDLLQPKFAARLRQFGTTPEEQRKCAAVADLVEGIEKFRKALYAYAEKPSGSNKNAALSALEDLRDDDVNTAWHEGLDFLAGANVPAALKRDEELCDAFQKFRFAFLDDKSLKTLKRQFEDIALCTYVIMDHLQALAARAKSSAELGGSGAVRAVFFGEGSFTTLVESRVHGYADGDIDPALDDRNVVESRQLGSGGFNTVELVTFKDGTKRVFKPEFAGRLAAENSPILTGLVGQLDSRQELTRINRAVNRTADALGLGDVMVGTTAGTHNGVFGMYMELAPGVEARRLARDVGPRFDAEGNKISLGTDEIKALPPDRRRLVRGRMMRQLNRLHWFDAITGQGDRHNANYMVQVKPDLTVVVKAIDNDASFGATRTGLTKFLLPPAMAEDYTKRVGTLSLAYGTKSKLALDAATKGDPGYRKLKDGSIEIDVSKAKSPLTVCGLYNTTAFHQAAIPDEMDYELCQKLKGLKEGRDREELLKDWADRLGGPRSPQYLNAKTRLDEAIACAERLEGEGKVYRAEDWENGDVQKRILDAELPQNLTFESSQNLIGGTIVQAPTGNAGRTLVADYQYMMAGSLYVRDFGKWE